MKNVVKRYFSGVIFLSIAAIIAKIFSMLYKILLQNLVGNIGFYIYQQIYPLYGIFLVLELTGLPLYISQLLNDVDEGNKVRYCKKIYYLLTIVCFAVFLVLEILSPLLASYMHNHYLINMIRIISIMVLFVPFLSVVRGFTQSQLDMHLTGISQIVEQFCRVGFIILIAILTVRFKFSLYRMGNLMMITTVLSSFIAVITLILLIKFKKNHNPIFISGNNHISNTISYNELFIKIVQQGGTLFLIISIIVIFQLVDSFTVKGALLSAGCSSHHSEFLKSIYDRSQPIIQVGVVIFTSICTGLLPLLSKYKNKKQFNSALRLVKTTLRIGLVFAIFITLGIVFLMPILNKVLFNSVYGNSTLAITCSSIVFIAYFLMNSIVIFQSRNYKYLLKIFFIGFLVKLFFNWIFVYRFGIVGAGIITLLSFITMDVFIFINKNIYEMKVFNLKQILGLMLAVMFSGCVLYWIDNLIIKVFVSRILLLLVLLLLIGFLFLEVVILGHVLNIFNLKELKNIERTL